MGERRPGRGDKPPPSNGAVTTLVPAADQGKQAGPLIEFSTISKDDPNEGIVFGETPEHCSCPHCERSVVTFIDHEASWVTWLLAFVVWFSLGWMALWVLPLLWPAFKDVVHHCPRCLNVITRKSRISLPTFRTEVMSFKIGGCAVVLARKYVAILIGLIGVIVLVYFLRSTVQLNTIAEVERGPDSSLSWEDFLHECGPRSALRHRTSTARAFEEKFRRKTFKWQGEVRVIREGFDVLFVRTKSVVMVKMSPPRFPRRDMPDIALIFGEERNPEVGTLEPGDWVEFEATMIAHGFRGDPEVMSLWHIGTIPRPKLMGGSLGGSGGGDDSISKAGGSGGSGGSGSAGKLQEEGKVQHPGSAADASKTSIGKSVPEKRTQEAAAQPAASVAATEVLGKPVPETKQQDAAAQAAANVAATEALGQPAPEKKKQETEAQPAASAAATESLGKPAPEAVAAALPQNHS